MIFILDDAAGQDLYPIATFSANAIDSVTRMRCCERCESQTGVGGWSWYISIGQGPCLVSDQQDSYQTLILMWTKPSLVVTSF